MENSPISYFATTVIFGAMALSPLHSIKWYKEEGDKLGVILSLSVTLIFFTLAAIPMAALFLSTPVEMTPQEYEAYQEFREPKQKERNNAGKRTFRVNEKKYEEFKESQAKIKKRKSSL